MIRRIWAWIAKGLTNDDFVRAALWETPYWFELPPVGEHKDENG